MQNHAQARTNTSPKLTNIQSIAHIPTIGIVALETHSTQNTPEFSSLAWFINQRTRYLCARFDSDSYTSSFFPFFDIFAWILFLVEVLTLVESFNQSSVKRQQHGKWCASEQCLGLQALRSRTIVREYAGIMHVHRWSCLACCKSCIAKIEKFIWTMRYSSSDTIETDHRTASINHISCHQRAQPLSIDDRSRLKALFAWRWCIACFYVQNN